jgi:glycosyltransferase involved in cell wall biosynthesis
MARIFVNLLSYTGKKGGMETYVRELFRELGTRDDGNQYVGYASTEFMKLDHSWFPGTIIDSGFSGENRVVWAFAELFMVARAARRAGADLIHSPANLGPWRSKVPSVYTIHDLLYFHFPDHMAVPLYTKPVQWMEQRAANNATVIITDSVGSSVDIQKYLNFPEDRIRVVELAGTAPKMAIERGAQREPDLLLAVGARIPHKNFESLVRAIALIPVEQRPRLVITGGRGDDPLQPVVDELGLAEWVDLKTWVPDEELAWLYAHATALLEPAFWGGSNLPALEAMLVGLPVLMSDNAVFREVGGDGAGYFDASDLESIAAAMLRATTDPEWLRDLAEKGEEHQKRFTWKRTADETLDAYNDTIGYRSRAKSRRR